MIGVNNLASGKVDENFLKRVARMVLRKERREKNLSLVLVGQKRIKELNRKYRKKNRETDVLSFDYRAFFVHGEILLCPAVIRKNAKKYGLPFKKELARTLIHGLLHILGYSHKRMAKKEEYYLSKL